MIRDILWARQGPVCVVGWARRDGLCNLCSKLEFKFFLVSFISCWVGKLTRFLRILCCAQKCFFSGLSFSFTFLSSLDA